MIIMEREEPRLFKKISIIIPTYNRVKYIRHLFISLNEELKSFEGESEVIIIDSSELKERIEIAELCNEFGFDFYFINCCISKARNYGIKTAKFPIILFIDSDCKVISGILEEHIKSYLSNDIAGVLGLTEFKGKKNWVWKVIERSSFDIGFSFANRMDYALWGPCSNISFRKDIIEGLGGFKTDFPFNYSGEDVDLGLRINKEGYKIKCNPKAIVHHTRETWSNFRQICKKIFRWGRTDFYLLNNHPHLSHIEFPKFISLLFISLIISLSLAFFNLLWEVIIFLSLWVILIPFFIALFKTFGNKRRSFIYYYIAFWLNRIFEFGVLIESLRRRKLSLFYKKLLYGKGQLIFEWKNRLIEGWSYLITFLILLIIITYFF